MSIQIGQTLAHYRIDHKLGEGGMGEVWAATDTRLNRSAAIKSLPPAVAADGERLARFKREAQLLAALNHPNIAAIYGLEQADGAPYLAMELVEGEDLSERIDRGAIPPDEALEIALQIAAGLEEAHEKGIIHRDLKPANIKLAEDGKVKVLDFGLAKALSQDPSESADSLDLAKSPTLTAAMGTQAGMILGTAGYMAPEQARGKKVDRRADVWAFGVILFEMLTGTRLFHGETVTDVIAAVVTREPDWDQLPSTTPAAMRRVLKRCLQKDPRQRLRDVGDAALILREAPDDPTAEATAAGAPATPTSRRPWVMGAAGLVLGLVLAYTIVLFGGSGEATRPPTWVNLSPPVDVEIKFTSFLELSPDGRKVVFVAPLGEDGELVLWVRDLGSEQARPLEGTEGADQPFWSPDSRSIGFFAGRKLHRIDAGGGVPQELADASNAPRGAVWGDGKILFVPDWSEPVYSISDTGGEPKAVTQFNPERLELSHRWPHLLPDGKHFFYYVVSTYPQLNPENPSKVDQSGTYIGSFDGAEPRLLLRARSRVAYKDGWLLYVDDNILTARPFDLERLEFSGEPLTITNGVTQSVGALWGGALFSVSDEGTLMFVRGAPELGAMGQMTWYDREGTKLGTVGDVQNFNTLRISHDGTRVAAAASDPADVWIYDLQRGATTRFTFDPGNDVNPVWSSDDTTILFSSTRVIPGKEFSPGNLFRKAASGLEPEEHISATDLGPALFPTDWSPDGRHVAFDGMRQGTGSDIVIYSFEEDAFNDLLMTEDTEGSAMFSPNGRWLAYSSDESDVLEIYVRAFPDPGGKWQVSNSGGGRPVWSPDGKELFYVDPDQGLMSVAVETEGGFRHDTPVLMFPLETTITAYGTYHYDVSPDAERFLILNAADDAHQQSARITLIQGWNSPGFFEGSNP